MEDPAAVTAASTAAVTASVTADVSALDGAERSLVDLDVALARLDAGHYGSCEACGAGIDPAELEASPLLRRCAAHPG